MGMEAQTKSKAGAEPRPAGEDEPFVNVNDVGSDRKEEVFHVVEHRLFGTSVQFIGVVVTLTVCYWFLSGGLTLFNKWFFSTRGFRFPILVVMGTFVLHFAFMLALRLLSGAFPNTGMLPKKQSASMTVYLRYLVPIGACTALEIASSNLALMKLSVSFHTMVHASKPIFIAGWSVAVGLQRPHLKLFLIVGLVTLGVMMLSIGESGAQTLRDVRALNITAVRFEEEIVNREIQPQHTAQERKRESAHPSFSVEGLLLILFSCFVSGARWALVQLMLQRIDLGATSDLGKGGEVSTRPDERMSPMNLVFYAAPVSAISLLPFFLAVERSSVEDYIASEVDATSDLFGFQFIVSIWSLSLNLVEFYFVKTTSGLLLSFAAISKELLLVVISVLMNGDDLPPLNILGFILCATGIILYHSAHASVVDAAAPKAYDALEQQAICQNAEACDKRSPVGSV